MTSRVVELPVSTCRYNARMHCNITGEKALTKTLTKTAWRLDCLPASGTIFPVTVVC